LSPRNVDVTVRGPEHRMKDLKLSAQNVYVDLEGFAAGNRVAKIETALPEGVELVHIRPSEATVQVSPPPGTRRRRSR
ncbi:MAG: CdaR family protein, partial [Candidatus Binatia bacterium]